ncbi:MAG: hypothetical protein WA964_12970 [Ilumatobacter sp.]|uniref:hypothetical protein n=1 Tax=Ilumatobacter sp. TaxID=1967498 RepID=UPI003C7401B0
MGDDVCIDAIEPMCWQTLAPVLLDALAPSSHASVAVIGAVRVGDPEATRTVYTTIVVLVVLGVVLAALAFWVLRRTRPEPELLAPLETMQTRGWRRLDPAAQRRSLDEARPTGAAPLRREASAPAVDSSFATVAPVASFDDLSDRDADDTAGAVVDETVGGPRLEDDATAGHLEADGSATIGDDADPASATSASRDDTDEIEDDGRFAIEVDTETVDVAVVPDFLDPDPDTVVADVDAPEPVAATDAGGPHVDGPDTDDEDAGFEDDEDTADADDHDAAELDVDALMVRSIDPLLGSKSAPPSPTA